jgi:hypothetical protein
VGYDAGGCNGELDIRCQGFGARSVLAGDTGHGRREEGTRDTSRLERWGARKGMRD